jgi:hypothetical protein
MMRLHTVVQTPGDADDPIDSHPCFQRTMLVLLCQVVPICSIRLVPHILD